MASSAAPSAISRYRPAVLVITGLAAAYGSYLVYSSLTNTGSIPQKSGRLHRSNAVHRPGRRRRHSVSMFSFRQPADGGLGQLHCQHGERQVTHDIGSTMPSDVEMIQSLGISTSQAHEVILEMEMLELEVLLQYLQTPPEDFLARHHEYQVFVTALQARDLRVLTENAHLLTDAYWRYSSTSVLEALARYTARESVEPIHGIEVEVLEEDFLNTAETETLADESETEENTDPGHGMKGLLYHIAEEEAKRTSYVHRGTRCDSCGILPIRGVRWHCINCPDFDLCSTCETQGVHPRTHVFAKIRIPIPTLSQPHHIHDLWYPGNPRQRLSPLKPAIRKRLSQESGLDDVQIDAYYEQFSCLVNTASENDPTQVHAAIDRFTFNKAMTSDSWPHPLQPNFLYDRMFHFYDTNEDGLIDFQEFISGLSYQLHPAKRTSFERLFRGYDVDGDGYVCRADFMRMLSAKYAIHKTIIMDTIAIEDSEPRSFGQDAGQIVRSSQPISSAFTEADVPQGEQRRARNKPVDRFGDPQVLPNGLFSETILPDGESEIDNSFWEAVFDRYQRPQSLSELHPQFNSSLDARVQVRPRYTGSEAQPVTNSTDGDQYLVRTDARGERGYHHNRPLVQSSNSRPSMNIGRSDAEGSHPLESVLDRGQTFPVPAAEKDLRQEVLFQVIEEGFNELLDGLFQAKEQLAMHVRTTRQERIQWRDRIDDYKIAKQEFREELKTGSDVDPLMAIANSSYGKVSTWAEANGRQEVRQAAIETVLADRSSNTGEPDSTVLVGRQQDASQEIGTHITRQRLIPTDDESLESMESSIREQSLVDLLESAGYSIASPAAEPSRESEQELPLVDASMQGLPTNGVAEFAVEDNEEADPTLPQNRPSASGTGSAHDDQETRDPTLPQNRPNTDGHVAAMTEADPMQLSPSSPPTPSPPEELSELLDTSDTSFDRSGAVEFDTVRALPEYPGTPESYETSMEEPGSSFVTTAGDDTVPEVEEEQQTVKNQDRSKSPPSSARLEWLLTLDEAEKEILEREGPGLLNYQEFEEILLKDVREGQGVLKGIAESWLEWAAF